MVVGSFAYNDGRDAAMVAMTWKDQINFVGTKLSYNWQRGGERSISQPVSIITWPINNTRWWWWPRNRMICLLDVRKIFVLFGFLLSHLGLATSCAIWGRSSDSKYSFGHTAYFTLPSWTLQYIWDTARCLVKWHHIWYYTALAFFTGCTVLKTHSNLLWCILRGTNICYRLYQIALMGCGAVIKRSNNNISQSLPLCDAFKVHCTTLI